MLLSRSITALITTVQAVFSSNTGYYFRILDIEGQVAGGIGGNTGLAAQSFQLRGENGKIVYESNGNHNPCYKNGIKLGGMGYTDNDIMKWPICTTDGEEPCFAEIDGKRYIGNIQKDTNYAVLGVSINKVCYIDVPKPA